MSDPYDVIRELVAVLLPASDRSADMVTTLAALRRAQAVLAAQPVVRWSDDEHRTTGDTGRWYVAIDRTHNGYQWGLYAKHMTLGLQCVDSSYGVWIGTLDDAKAASVAALRAHGVLVREVAM